MGRLGVESSYMMTFSPLLFGFQLDGTLAITRGSFGGLSIGLGTRGLWLGSKYIMLFPAYVEGSVRLGRSTSEVFLRGGASVRIARGVSVVGMATGGIRFRPGNSTIGLMLLVDVFISSTSALPMAGVGVAL